MAYRAGRWGGGDLVRYVGWRLRGAIGGGVSARVVWRGAGSRGVGLAGRHAGRSWRQGQWRVGLRYGGELVALVWWSVHGGDYKAYH